MLYMQSNVEIKTFVITTYVWEIWTSISTSWCPKPSASSYLCFGDFGTCTVADSPRMYINGVNVA